MRRRKSPGLYALALCVSGITVMTAGFVFGAPPFPVPPTLSQGQFFFPPAWNVKLSVEERFQLVLEGEAVLDRETGLVWEKAPESRRMVWYAAVDTCIKKVVGGRMGWRLGTVEELSSLVDPTQTDPALPPGHPFVDIQDYYYTITTDPEAEKGFSNYAYAVGFRGTIGPSRPPSKEIELFAWCVRGGRGYDGFRIP